jgi:fructose-1,6-bisphosphatase II / sedoheptulose-1,7-bisphosphatase
MLYIGEKVGVGGGPKIDIALDPLEGTTITAKAGPTRWPCWPWPRRAGCSTRPTPIWTRSLSARAARGRRRSRQVVTENLKNLAKAKGVDIATSSPASSTARATPSSSPRCAPVGCRIVLISDGDVAGVIATTKPGHRRSTSTWAQGGAPEGVLAAARFALRRRPVPGPPVFRNDDERGRAAALGHHRPRPQVQPELDLAKGDVMFAGDRRHRRLDAEGRAPLPNGASTHSMVMRSKTGTVRIIEAHAQPSADQFLPDPSHLKDMDQAIARLARRRSATGETDRRSSATTTSMAPPRRRCCCGSSRSRSAGRNMVVYIPDRMKEGYGPNAPALLKLKAQGAAVVDHGGLRHHRPCARWPRSDAGLDVLVIDHHVAELALPPAVAVVDPNRLDESSPHRQLAAVGVAFLLASASTARCARPGWYSPSGRSPT